MMAVARKQTETVRSLVGISQTLQWSVDVQGT